MSLAEIKKRIDKTEVSFDRSIGSTKLIAVSKVQPNDRVKSVLEEGHRVLAKIGSKRLNQNGLPLNSAIKMLNFI